MKTVEFTKYTRTYATRANAEKAIEKIPGIAQLNESMVVIASQYGRFSPVFFLRGKDLQFAVVLAEQGFNVVG